MANVNSVSSSSSTSSLYGSRNVLTGLATGMDTEAMIENSISSYKTKISGFQQQQTKIEWQQEAYRSITDKMIELGSKYTSYTSSTNLTSASFFNAATKTVAAGTYASKVSATGKSDNDIQITSATMATAARFTAKLGSGVTASKKLSELDDGLGNDFSLTINGTAIGGLNGDSTVSDLMNAINNSGADVKASFSSITGEMVFTATETGANSAINFSGNLKQLFGLGENEELTQSENYTAGNDAVLSVVVNGTTTTVTSSSNTFNLDGLNVTLKGNFEVTGTQQEAVSFTTQTNDTSIWFYPNDDDVEYLIGLENADSMAVGGYANAAAYWTDYVAYMEAYAEYYGATLADLTMYGPVYATYEDLVIGGNYIFMAQAYNGGRFNSDLVTVNFTVPALASAPKMETKGQFDKKLSMKKAKKININRDIKVARK